ncbi:MAG: hypothetical protein ACLFTT_16910 [Candidatus Hydrogenedentota bacterium]
MALEKCGECGKDVSSKAARCPNCGAPVEKVYKSFRLDRDDSGCGCLIILAVIVCIVILMAILSQVDDARRAARPASKPEPVNRNVLRGEHGNVNRAEHYYVRIGFSIEPGGRPLSPRCRMWIRGYGDFYPAQQSDWQFGGTLIERAGPFPKAETQTLYFYPYYTHGNEGLEIYVPFRYSEGLSPTSPRDMITITVKPSTIEFFGTPIKNATGQFSWEIRR